jgi:hypothetical protein
LWRNDAAAAAFHHELSHYVNSRRRDAALTIADLIDVKKRGARLALGSCVEQPT